MPDEYFELKASPAMAPALIYPIVGFRKFGAIFAQ